MKKFIEKIKNWFFRPISPVFKTRGIIISLFSLFVFSVIMSICVHWAFAFIPVLLLALVLYIAKLPLKVLKNNKTD